MCFVVVVVYVAGGEVAFVNVHFFQRSEQCHLRQLLSFCVC